MNVGIGNEAAQVHFWESLFRIFGLVSLQCTYKEKINNEFYLILEKCFTYQSVS